MIRRRWLASFALVLCGACGVGEPLVDKFPPSPRDDGYVVSCRLSKECEEAPALEITQPVARMLSWQSCSTPCGASGVSPPTGTSDSDAHLPFECLELESLDSLASDLSCASARFAASTTAAAVAAGADVIAQGVRWRSVNIVIEAEAPLEVIVSEAEVSDARFHLRGPITLRFQDETSLERVSISGTSPAAEVVFDRLHPNEVTVGDGADPFPGLLTARHTAFMAPSFAVAEAELDSVMIESAFFAADELISNDGALHDVMLDVDRAMFAPTALENVLIASCESLSFFGSELRKVHVPRCNGEPTRVYDTDFFGGRLDGVVMGDGGKAEGVYFGLEDSSEYELWGLSVTSSAFCGNVDSLKASANAIGCSICSDGALDPPTVACTLPLGQFDDAEMSEEPKSARNFCEALDMLEPCPLPWPIRTRPIGDLE